MNPVAEDTGLFQDRHSLAGSTGFLRHVHPGFVEIGHGFLNARLIIIFKDNFQFFVIFPARLIIIQGAVFPPKLLIGIDIPGPFDGEGIGPGTDVLLPGGGINFIRHRRRLIHPLAGVPGGAGIGHIMSHRLKGQTVRADPAIHRIESGKCGTHCHGSSSFLLS